MEGTHAQTVSYPLRDWYKLCIRNNLDNNYEEKIGENVFEEQRRGNEFLVWGKRFHGLILKKIVS